MMMLAQLNQRGIFPAPQQQEETFWKKVEAIAGLPTSNAPALQILEPFDLNPTWVPIIVENKGLSYWEGAVLWQEQIDPAFTFPRVQVSTRSFKLYTQEELIAHELVHAARVDFKEEQFEEILAYATSSKAWRRWLGPFFRKPIEATLFLCAVVFTIALQAVELIADWSSGWLLLPWLPVLLIAAGLVRLQRTHSLFRRCVNHIASAIYNPEKKLAVVLRMSDAEIRAFAKMTPKEICHFVNDAKEKSLRWKMIFSTYFEVK